MRAKTITYIILLFLSGLCFNGSNAQNIKRGDSDIIVRANFDSTNVELGRLTTLHVSVIGSLTNNGLIEFPDSLWYKVEKKANSPRINDLGNGRKELNQDITIQIFDPGEYYLPVVYRQDSLSILSEGMDNIIIDDLAIEENEEINDFYPILIPEGEFFDFLPDWFIEWGIWVFLGILILAIGIFVYFKWIRKGKIPLLPKKKPIPPYELAMRQLNALKNANLWEKGEVKEYYTRLVDILRNYIDLRFGINAMEMTSSQIIEALKKNENTEEQEKYVGKILETADFVKFAKVKPLPDDNVSAFRSAVQFVEETRPIEPENKEEQPKPNKEID